MVANTFKTDIYCQDQLEKKVKIPCKDVLTKAREAQRDGSITVNIDKVLATAESVGKVPMMCYRVLARAPSDVFKSFQISLDPESATFYSTCYLRQSVVKMDVESDWWASTSSEAKEESSSPWEFEDRCISCHHAKTIYKHPVPQWVLSDTCVDCDAKGNGQQKPYSETHDPLASALVAANSRCDGWGSWLKPSKHQACGGTEEQNTWKCFKLPFAFRHTDKSYPWGLPWVSSVEECAYLTHRDPECSNQFMFSKNAYTTCICARNDACCGGCSPVYGKSDGNIYDVNSVPDPKCARGVTAKEPEIEYYNPPDSDRMFSSILNDATKGTQQARSMLVCNSFPNARACFY